MKNISVFGIYSDQNSVSEAIEALKNAGFRSTDVSVLSPENPGSKGFGHEKHTKAPEGALAGGGSGAVAGAAIGWLIGAGALIIPGLEQMAVAGPLISMLGGMGVGVTFGGLTGAAVGSGIPEYEAKRYQGLTGKGGALLSVHCDSDPWSKTARRILKQTGARDVSAAAEAHADFAASERPAPRGKLGSSMNT